VIDYRRNEVSMFGERASQRSMLSTVQR
jgi:hypothetical protein